MGDNRNLFDGQNPALVIYTFLQTDCRSSEYSKELLSLRNELASQGKEFSLTRDINCNGPRTDEQVDGDIEPDGHQPRDTSVFLNDIVPSVELLFPENQGDAAEIHRVAEELRDIAAYLEDRVVAQATRNLSRNISYFPSEHWEVYLNREVTKLMQHVVGLEHLSQERIILALTLTLVKGVCEQTPRFLRRLFSTMLQYIFPAGSR
ncbi:BH3 interacting domain death agonist [Toxotes jaculatrix]|uniref:BH3 interacting domain death agonist n=1 Tax=Toxotes jaculatrix TaxID=941984 RepID=UPI001B3AD2FE|nr:BH3 interacting domain death agonist [Toxotes jaculatrix]